MASSGVRAFLVELAESGRPRVAAAFGGDASRVDDGAAARLAELDLAARAEAAGAAPTYDPTAAAWAARALFLACQALALRGPDAAAVAEALGAMPAPAPTPSAAWSVDLTFACLPDLHRLARGLPADDPLQRAIAAWAAAWPLSSIGVPGAAPAPGPALEAVLTHAALRARYVDRVIATVDLPRLAEPRVAEAARAALGLHPELAPGVAEALGLRPHEAAP